MECSSVCMRCLMENQFKRIAKFKNDALKKSYLKKVMEIMAHMGKEDTAPYLSYRFDKIYEAMFEEIDFKFIKKDFNDLVLQREKDLKNRIKQAEDPLLTALLFSRMGNYIDYGTLINVSKEEFISLFDDYKISEEDKRTYARFRKNLGTAKNLLLSADNCGEIVLDRFLLEEISRFYPEIKLKVMVKAEDVMNDATREDAEQAGIYEIAEVVDTGNGIAGSTPAFLGREGKEALQAADIVLSKGQANFETLFGCGFNCYFSFLCKCEHFAGLFGVDLLTGMFIHEDRYEKMFGVSK